MPTVAYTAGYPTLKRSEALDRVGERAFVGVEWADPAWTVDVATKPLDLDERLLVEAFREQATALQTVLFKLLHEKTPAAYRTNPNAAAVNDAGSLVSVTGGKTALINGVTNGLTMSRGDLFSFAAGDYRSLHRVMANAVAATGQITLNVEPAVPPYIAAGAVAKWREPELNMRVVPGSFQIANEFFPTATWQMTEVPR
jgi:hypothetical protein